MKQTEKVLRYMQMFGRITPREAINLGCYRLSGRIYDLKKEGYCIKTELKEVTNVDGSKSHIGVYSLC